MSPGSSRPIRRQVARTAGLLLSLLLVFFADDARAGLLDAVRRPDPATRWEVRSRRDGGNGAVVEASLVSQVWRGISWRHGLRLTRPASVRHSDLAVLIVGGDGERSLVDESRLGAEAGVVVALLRNVPNQPLFGHSEDDLIGHTFEQYLRSGEPDWPLLLPMTTAAVRAMDAVTDLASREWGLALRRFVVCGASKRGWTSWLAAAADRRVAGIAPVVFDNLNIAAQLANQRAVWGRYSPKLGDYVDRGLPALVGTERGRELLSVVDPYAYRDSLGAVAKLGINGSNDPYWELGASSLYWDDLPGAKSLLVVPNDGHDAGSDGRVPATLAAFVERVAEGRPMPELRWADGGGLGAAALTSSQEPANVSVWRADSPSRDFRAAHWQRVATRREEARFVAQIAPPEDSFVAVFGEAQYAKPGGVFSLSTPVRITPPPSAPR